MLIARQTEQGLQSNIRHTSGHAALLRHSSLIVWEEMPMSKKSAMECVDELLQQLMGSELPFGGKAFLGVGDFRQVAPIIKNATRLGVVEASPQSSHLWPTFRILRLHQAIRHASDPEYSSWVDDIGDGHIVGEDIKLDLVNEVTDVEDAVVYLYPDHSLRDYETLQGRSFLSPLNVSVDDFNQRVLNRIPEPATCYRSIDGLKESEGAQRNLNPTSDLSVYLALLRDPGVPPAKLELKVGSICRIIRNMNAVDGLVKNARVVVIHPGRRYVEVRLLAEPNHARTFLLPRINFEFKPDFAPWTVLRRQIPLRLAYAATFNSCQGLTLDRCVVDLRTPVFSHGQLYTSLTRVRHRDHLRALYDADNQSQATSNVVFPELLL